MWREERWLWWDDVDVWGWEGGGGTELPGEPGGWHQEHPPGEGRHPFSKVRPTNTSSITCLLERVPGQVSLRNTGLNAIQQVSPGCCQGSLCSWPQRFPQSPARGGAGKAECQQRRRRLRIPVKTQVCPAGSGQPLRSTDNLPPTLLSIRRRKPTTRSSPTFSLNRGSGSPVTTDAHGAARPTLPRPRGPSRPCRSPSPPSCPLTFLSLNSTSSPS